jgi:NAD(P)-dependent dehydrogenase (short-subunit alcohol dehydrogenase family)
MSALKRAAILTAAGVGAGVAAAVAVTGAGVGLAAYAILKRARRCANLDGKVVLITGGSRGLGLQMAREFARQGCRIAICARDAAGLERAEHDLKARGADVWTHVCDVSDLDQVKEMIQAVVARFGGLDILVPNAGTMCVGPVEQMSIDDFERAMSVMFWGVLYPIWAALPLMMGRGSGQIVTITSIGGKISVPHLLPYSCAKFAAVALSEGLRAELAPHGIGVLTVVPGLMRTGSYVQAEFKGRQDRELAWFGVSANTPGLSMSAERAAAKIVDCVRRGRSECILTLPAQVLARVHGAFPELSGAVLSLAGRILPGASAGSGEAISGREAEQRLNSRLFRAATTLGRTAGARMHEAAP